ncbi:MAG: phosphoserine phosphatase SerB [Casimicrobiaceae bacterium]
MPLDPLANADLVVQASQLANEDLHLLQALTGASEVVPLDRAQCAAFRLVAPQTVEGIADALATADCDWALVPRARRLERLRLVALDMDSTLITIECIDEIAGMRGIKSEVAAITSAAMRGEIDFRESLVRRVALLEGLPVNALQRVFDERLRLSPGAAHLFDSLRARGVRTLLASGGFTFFTDRLQAGLRIDWAVANQLEMVAGGLTGRVTGDIVDAAAKAALISKLADQLRGDDGLVAVIGDGANDLPMFSMADISVAWRAKPTTRAQATHTIDHCGLDALLNLFA